MASVNDILRVTIEFLIHGQRVMNTLHYKITGTGAGDSQVVLAGILDTAMPTVLEALSNEVLYVRTVVQHMLPLPPRPPAVNSDNAGLGDIASQPLPVHVAATITTRTEFAGPRYRGRVFIAGLPEEFAEDSLITGTAKDALQAIAAEYFSVRTQSTWTFVPVLLHRDTLTTEVITAAEAREVLRSLRRRQVGRGI